MPFSDALSDSRQGNPLDTHMVSSVQFWKVVVEEVRQDPAIKRPRVAVIGQQFQDFSWSDSSCKGPDLRLCLLSQ